MPEDGVAGVGVGPERLHATAHPTLSCGRRRVCERSDPDAVESGLTWPASSKSLSDLIGVADAQGTMRMGREGGVSAGSEPGSKWEPGSERSQQARAPLTRVAAYFRATTRRREASTIRPPASIARRAFATVEPTLVAPVAARASSEATAASPSSSLSASSSTPAIAA